MARRIFHIGVIILVTGLLLFGGPCSVRAQSGMQSIEAVSTGGGTSALSGGVAGLYTNPAHLTVGTPEYTTEVQLFRIGVYSGGDLFQFNHYSTLFVHETPNAPPLSDAEEKATLDAWFGSSMRSATSYLEVTPLAMTYRSPGGRWGLGLGIRGRVIQKTSLDKGLLDLLLRGTEPNRTVPVNGRMRLYSLLDVTGTFSYRFSSFPLSVGVSPRFILGTGYADGILNSRVVVNDESLTHHFAYTTRAAGTLSTGLYDNFDAFSAEPLRQVLGSTSGIAGRGGGLDIGLSYALRPGLHLSMSITDLGVVQWDEHAQTVTPTNETFRFDGLSLDLQQLNDEYGGDVGAYLTHQVDSLAQAAYQDVERERAPFRTRLPARVHLGSTWDPGGITLNGGVSMGLNETAGTVPRSLAAHVGGEVALGPFPVRAGVRMLGSQALTVSGGLGLEIGEYRLDLGGSVTPKTSMLGAGARYAVSASLGTLRK
jgi:hypothetical protein